MSVAVGDYIVPTLMRAAPAQVRVKTLTLPLGIIKPAPPSIPVFSISSDFIADILIWVVTSLAKLEMILTSNLSVIFIMFQAVWPLT